MSHTGSSANGPSDQFIADAKEDTLSPAIVLARGLAMFCAVGNHILACIIVKMII